MDKKQSPIIIGGGIAGLSSALALAHKGISCTIFETCKKFEEVGAGLQLAPNATRLLQQFGLLEDLQEVAVEPIFLELRDGLSSNRLLQVNLRDIAKKRWNAPYITIHRADLHKILLQKVLKHPLISLNIAEPLTKIIKNESSTVEIETETHGLKQQYTTNFLIGCDGVWSKMRQFNNVGNYASFTGFIAWRATLQLEQLPKSFVNLFSDLKTVTAWMGPLNHLVVYPLQSGKAFNFVAITKADNKNDGDYKSWSREGDRDKLLYHFKNWNSQIRSVFETIEHWTYWPLNGMTKYVLTDFKNQAYVGDSSHAMLPFAAQGAAMAIEDAATLAEVISIKDIELSKALTLYHKIRYPRLAAVNKRGAFNRKVYHASGPLAFARNLTMKLRPAEKFMTELDWLYSYDASKILDEEMAL